MKIIIKFTSVLFLLFSLNIYADGTPIQVCFTPGGNCTADVVRAIDHAHKTLLIQAYQLTSQNIEDAVVDAKHRGVDVKIILDKSQVSSNHASSAKFFSERGVPVWIDYKPHIAHNKIMVIDHEVVVTGSFNFTRSAQLHNAENLLIIENPQLASIYTHNWESRLAVSETLREYEVWKESKHNNSSKKIHHRRPHSLSFF